MVNKLTQKLSSSLKIFNKLGVQVAVINITLFIIVFTILVGVTMSSSQQAFAAVIRSEIPRWQMPFRNQGGNLTQIDIIQFDADGVKRVIPLDVKFRDEFMASIISVLLVSIGIGGLGAFLTWFLINSPLRKLKAGIAKLRQNKYTEQLSVEGPVEIESLIQEFNQLASELQRVEELRKDLISDTSHELKTPITSLKVQLESVRDGILSLDPERLNTLLGQVDRLHELVESLQTYSRLRSKSIRPDKAKLKLTSVITAVTDSLQTQAQNAQIELVVNVPQDLEIEADSHLLHQVITNLVQNSIDYSQGTQITISANADSFTISDDGIGVSPEHLPYLTERFYRVEKSRNRATGGMGLGLAIVSEIVSAHGWSMEITSRQKDSHNAASGLSVKVAYK